MLDKMRPPHHLLTVCERMSLCGQIHIVCSWVCLFGIEEKRLFNLLTGLIIHPKILNIRQNQNYKSNSQHQLSYYIPLFCIEKFIYFSTQIFNPVLYIALQLFFLFIYGKL